MASNSTRRSASSASRRGASSASKPAKGKRKSVSSSRSGKASRSYSRSSSASAKSRSRSRSSSKRDQGQQQGRRVGDVRRAQRDERARAMRSRYRRYVLRIALAIVAVLALIFGGIALYRSDLFAVTTVNVNGVSHMTSAEITELAAVGDDSTLLRLDVDGIVGRLQESPWIQSASIRREFPDTIEIDVVERTPGAVVQVNDKSSWVISSDGTWLSAATNEDKKNQMNIIDVSGSLAAPMSGTACDDAGITGALEIINSLSDDLKSQVASISAESSIKTTLNLENGVEVAFGDSSDIQLKESVITELLDKFKGKVSYINVRVPERPTYRTMS